MRRFLARVQGRGCLLAGLSTAITAFALLATVFLVDVLIGWRQGRANLEDRPGSTRYAVIRELVPGSSSTTYMKTPTGPVAGRERVDSSGFLEPSHVHQDPDLTIVFLGGSTTESMFVKEDLRFPYLAGRLIERATGLKVNALNGGRQGNDTRHMMHLLTTKVLAEEPRYVVFMENVNDLNVLMNNKAYWKNGVRPQITNGIRASLNQRSPIRPQIVPGREAASVWLRETLRQPGLFFNIRERVARLLERREGRGDEWAEVREEPLPVDPVAILATYSSSVESLITYCRAWKIEPVLMTQFERFRDKDLKLRPNLDVLLKAKSLTFDEYVGLHEAFNQRVRELAARFKVPLIDLVRVIPHDGRHLYDSIHLTDEGSRLAAETIAAKFVETLSASATPSTVHAVPAAR